MSRKSYKNPRYEELIPVVYARNLTEAEFYRSLLEDHDIPVLIEEIGPSAESSAAEMGVPVLVPEDNLIEARDIIEQRIETDDEIEAEFDEYSDHQVELYDYDEIDHDIIDTNKTDETDKRDYS